MIAPALETEGQIKYRLYLESDHWKALRESALKRDGYRCVHCPCQWSLQVHHLLYRTRWEDSVVADLITLCRGCHEREHGIGVVVKPVAGISGTAGKKRWNIHGDRVNRKGRPYKPGPKKKHHRHRKKFRKPGWNFSRRQNWKSYGNSSN